MTTSKSTFVEKLEAVHTFPGEFEFKILGENSPAFEARVLARKDEMFPGVEHRIARKVSSKGRHQSITLSFEVESAERVEAFYAHLEGLEGLKMML